jgi:hypothetical protein
MTTRSCTTLYLALLALAFVSVVTAAEKDKTVRLVGTDIKGDVVRWQDGSVWSNVTVTRLEVSESGRARIVITNVPDAAAAGVFTNFLSAALRGESEPPPVSNPMTVLQDYPVAPTAQTNLPPLKTEFGDSLICALPPGRAEFPISNSAKVLIDGKLMFARLSITITHVVVQKDRVFFLARGRKGNTSFRDGWYSDARFAIFDREHPK